MRRLKKKFRYNQLWGKKAAKVSLMGVMIAAFLGSGPALANPSGGQVRAGNVNISQVGPNTLHIEQMTQKAIIDWQKFGINANEAVRFLQPNQMSVILNRVVGQDPSKILGSMSANGNVWLINPNGVLFGPGSTVNVGGLVASTLNISNADFLKGNYRFTQDAGKPLASVINQGSITITDGGYAVLMAPLVSNEGLIVANLGKVELLAGESTTLNFDGRNLVSYDIGKMAGDAGTVVVSRDTVSQLLSEVITTPELTEAGEIRDNGDGTVSLLGASGTVVNEGTIQANGKAGQDAGTVVLDSGRLTVVGSEATIEASGKGADSDGGTVLALSDGMLYTQAGSELKARGSDQGGDGGFVETSGKQFVIQSVADVGASAGKAGEWLIDPEFLTIFEGPNTFGDLDGSTDTTGLGAQISTISTGFLESITSGTVTLHADSQITVNDLNGGLPGMINFQDGVSVEFVTTTGDLLFADRNDGVRVGGTGSITTSIGRDIYLGVLQSEGTGTITLGYGRDLIDGNGAGANIIGDYLNFDATSHAVQTSTGALQIAGWTGSNPIEINLASSANTVDIVSVGGANGHAATSVDLDMVSSVLSSGNFRTGDSGQAGDGTNVNVVHSGNLIVNGLQARDVDLNATGTIVGGAVATDLAAVNAVVSGSQIGNGGAANVLATDVANLDVEGRNNNSTVRVNTTDAALTDLSVRSRNSNVIVDGVTVANGNPATLNYDDGATANNFTFIESGNRTAQIGALAAQSVTLDFQSSILDTAGTGVISADTITLQTRTAGAGIGALTPTSQPIRVQGSGGAGTPTSVSAITNNGDVNIAHTDGTASLTYNAAVGNVLDASDTGTVSLSNVSYENAGGADVNVNVIGAVGASMANVTVRAVGNILDAQADGNGGALNIVADNLTLVSSGGSVGLTTDEIEVRTNNLTASAPGGVFIGNQGNLEVFNFITDGATDSRVTASNGGLQLSGGVLSTTSPIGDVSAGDPTGNLGDTDSDGYDVTINVDSSGDITLGGVVAGDATPTGALNGVLLNVISAGNILSGGTTPNIDVTNGDVRLTSLSGSVGTVADQIETTVTGSSRVDAQGSTEVGLSLTGSPTDLTVAHDDGNVDVDFTGGTINRTGAGLAINGDAAVPTINYTNRTAGEVIGNGGVTSDATDISITATGNINGTPGGTADIIANNGSVAITTTGSFDAEAESSGTGNLDLRQVDGSATVTVLAAGSLLLTDTTGGTQSAGSLTVNTGVGATTTLGSLTVGGDATFNNAGTVTNDEAVTTDLVADNLSIVTSGADTTFDVDTDVNSITIDDDAVGGGSGNFTIDNAGHLDSVTLDSRGTGPLAITTSAGAALNYSPGGLFASNPDIGTVTINEALSNILGGPVDLSQSTDVNLTTTDPGKAIITGPITVSDTGNLTVNASGIVSISTDVGGTLDVTSQTGAISFMDTDTNGPANISVRTVAGQNVLGTWRTGPASSGQLVYNSGSDSLNVFSSAGQNTTNLTFQTDQDNIVLGQVDVDNGGPGAGGDLTLIATSTAAGEGQILDNGENTTADILANNATLLAYSNIGSPADPIEVDVPGTLTGRSDTGGVFFTSTTIVEHLVIDVLQQDYFAGFNNYAGGMYTVSYDGDAAGANNLTFTGTADGTDFTLIERGLDTVNINSNINVVGAGGQGDDDFIRIISGGGMTNASNSTLTAANVDLIANNGDIGSSTAAMILDTLDVCVSASGRDVEGYVYVNNEVRNLVLNVNQSTGGAGNVEVGWNNSGTDYGLTVAGAQMDSGASITANSAPHNSTTVDEAHVILTNGVFDLNGQFYTAPSGNTETFERLDSFAVGAGIGGDIVVGDYTAVQTGTGFFAAQPQDTYLELRTTNGGSIVDDGNAGTAIDLTNGGANTAGGALTLVSMGGDIGGVGSPVSLVSDGNMTQRTTVNAYTTQGDITLDSTGNITYNEVYAGTNVDSLAPFHSGGFQPGGIGANGSVGNPGIVPEQAPGDVTLTAGGEICAVDIIAGSLADAGNVLIETTGDGDILVGNIVAQGDTVTLRTAAGFTGSILEKDNEPGTTNTEVVADELIADVQGVGGIGFWADDTTKRHDAFDMVVNHATVTTSDGGVYLRNIGNIIYDLVDAESSTGEDVYLVSEGVTFANDVQAGNTTDMDLLIETNPGSDLMVGNVQAINNTATLISTDRIRSDITGLGTTGRVQANNVLLLAEGGIGVDGSNGGAPLHLLASTPGGTVTVSANSALNGNVFLDSNDPAGLVNNSNIIVGTVVDNICNMANTGIQGGTVCVDSDGTLAINEDITATGDILLEADGNITLGDNDATTFSQVTRDGTNVMVARNNGLVDAGTNARIGVESTAGQIIDGNGNLRNLETGDGQIALVAATGIGNGDDIELTAASLAASGGTGEVRLIDQTGNLVIANFPNPASSPLKSGASVLGVSAANLVCVDVTSGDLQVNGNVSSTGTTLASNVALRASGDVTIGSGSGGTELVSTAAANSTGIVSIESGGQILGNNGAATNTSISGVDVVLDSVGGVGNSGDIGIRADRLAADGGTGDVMVRDNSGDLEVSTLQTIKGMNTLVGVDADDEVCIEVAAGALTLTQGIGANMGDPEARIVALKALGDIDLNNSANGQVVATDKISVRSVTGGITGTTDNNVADLRTTNAANGQVVIRTSNDIGAAADTLEIDTRHLAARSDNGSAYLQDLSGDVTIENILLEKGDGNVDGVRAANDVCVLVTNNLLVAANVTAGGNAALLAGGDVTIGDNSGTDDIVSANTTTGRVSIEAGGQLSADNGVDVNGNADTSIRAHEVVLDSTTGIGNSADVGIEADVLAADGGSGSAKLVDRTNNLVIDSLTTLKGMNSVVGVDAANMVCVDVLQGSLTLTEGINSDMGDPVAAVVALRARDNIDMNFTGNGAVVAGDKISIESTNGSLTGSNNADAIADLRTNNANGQIVIATNGSIGTPGSDLQIETDRFAARSATGSVYVEDRTGSLTVDSLTLEKNGPNRTVTGVTAATSVCLDVLAGDLSVNENIVAGTDVALRASDNVILGQSAGPTVGTVIAGNGRKVSVEAVNGAITDGNGGNLNLVTEEAGGAAVTGTGTIVLRAGQGIGDADDIEITASRLSANAATVGAMPTGGVNITDLTAHTNAGDATKILTITDGTVDKSGATVTGLSGAGQVCLDALTSALQISSNVTSTGADVAIRQSGNFGGNVYDTTIGDGAGPAELISAATKISIESSGEIIANNGVDLNGFANTSLMAPDIVLRGNEGVGNSGDVGIEADNLAAAGGFGTPGNAVNVIDRTGDLTITTLTRTKSGIDVVGVNAAQVCIDVLDGSLFVNDSIVADNGTLALRTGGVDHDIVIGDADANVEQLQARASGGPAAVVSLEASGDVLDNNGAGNAAVLTDGTVVVKADSLTDFAGTNAFEITENAGSSPNVGLAVDASSGGAMTGRVLVDDLSGNLRIVDGGTTIKGGMTVNGVTAPAEVCVDVLAGTLTVEANVTSGTNAALRASGDVTLGDTLGATRGTVRAANTVAVQSNTGNITDGNAGTVNLVTDADGGVSLMAGGGIGSDAMGASPNEIETDTTNFAATAMTGDVNIIELDTTTADGLSITAVTDPLKGISKDGVTAGTDVCIDVLANNLNVLESITAGDDVALRAANNVVLGDNAGANNGIVTAGSNGGDDTIAVQATAGNITDGNAGTVNLVTDADGGVSLMAGGGIGSDAMGASPNEIETDTTNFAATAMTGDVNIIELDTTTADGLSITAVTDPLKGISKDGVTAGTDVCIDVLANNLNVLESITAGDDVALRAANNVVLGDNAGANNGIVTAGSNGGDDTIAVQATAGNITDGNAGTVNLVTDADGGVSLMAGGGIGSDAMGASPNEIETDTTNFAATAMTGDVNIIELDTTTADGLSITAVTDPLKGISKDGVTAGTDVCIDVLANNLNVLESITAGDDVALRAANNVVLGDNAGANNGIVTAGSNGGDDTIAVQATAGNITDGNAGTVNLVTDADGGVSLMAGGGIGSDAMGASPNEIETDTTNFAATAMTGDVNIIELDTTTADGLSITAVTDPLKGISKDGVTAGTDVCIDVLANNLNVLESITAGDDVALRAANNVVLGDNAGANNGIVTAGSNGGDDTIAVQATAGNITDGNAGTVNLVTDADGGVSLMAGGGIGSDAMGASPNEIETDTTNFAATAMTGDVNIIELDTTTADGLSITAVTDPLKGISKDGVTAGTDVCIDVLANNLNVLESITAGDDVALRAANNVVLGDNAGANNGIVTAGSNGGDDTIAVQATAGNITDGNAGTVNLVTDADGGVSLMAGGGIGSDAMGASPNEIETDTTNFAATAMTGDVNIIELDTTTADGLSITAVTDPLKGISKDGVTAGTDVCIDVLANNLNVLESITAGDDVALRAANNVVLGDNAGANNGIVTAGSNGGDDTIAVQATAGNITDGNAGTVNLVTDADGGVSLMAGGGIGSDAMGASPNEIETDTTNFAATAMTGDVNIIELDTTTADGLSITAVTDPLKGISKDGVTAGTDVCIDVLANNLNVLESITAGDDVALRAANNVVLGDNAGANNGIVTAGSNGGDDTIAVQATAGNITDGNAGTVNLVTDADGGVSLMAGGGIGSDAMGASPNEIETDTTNFAATAMTGDVNIIELDTTTADGLSITAVTDPLKGISKDGVTAGTDVCIDVLANNLNVLESITAGDDVALRAANNVVLGDNAGANNGIVTAGSNGGDDTIAVQATAGNITDGNAGTVNLVTDADGGVSLMAGGGIGSDAMGASPNEIETDTTNFAATAMTGDVNIIELDTTTADGLSITAVTDPLKGISKDGVTAGTDVCIDVLANNLNVLESITAGDDVALRAANNVVLGDNAGANNGIVTAGSNGGDDTIAVQATAGNITDGNAGTVNLVTDADGGVSLMAGGGIGSDAMGASPNEIETDTTNFAATAMTGDVNIIELDTTTADGLSITAVTDPLKGISKDGVTAGTDVCIDILANNLNVLESITAGDDVALRAANNVVLGDNAGANNGIVTAGSNGGDDTIAVQATAGNITDGNAGTVNLVTDADGGVSLMAGGGIGSDAMGASPNEIETDTTNFAATAMTGDVNIIELDTTTADGLSITAVTDPLKGISKDGVTAGTDVCIDVLANNLNVLESITAGDDVALRAANNVVLGDNAGANNGIVTAGSNGGDDTIAVQATAGNITDGNAGTVNLVTDADGGVSLMAGGGIGSDATGTTMDSLETDTTSFAANAVTGDVNIVELDTATADGLTVTVVSDQLGKVTDKTGVIAGADVCIDVVDGALNINEDVTAGGMAALRTQGVDNDIIIGNGDTDVVTANNGNLVSIEASGELVDNNTTGNAAVVTTGSVVLDADSVTDGTGGAFELEASALAANADTGDIIVDDLSGNLALVEGLRTAKGDLPIDGITAAQLICVDVLNGTLEVDADITSANGDIALAAQGDITLGDTSGTQVGLITASDATGRNSDADPNNNTLVSIESRDGGVFDGQNDTGLAPVNNISNLGGDVVIDSATGVGGVSPNDPVLDNDIDIDATRFAANGGTGDVMVHDFDTDADGLDIDTLTTIKDGTVVNGITTAVDICLAIDNSDLIIDENLTAGGDIALKTFRDIILGDDVGIDNGVIQAGTAGDGVATVSLEAGGSIIDGNGDATTDDGDPDNFADGVNVIADEVVMQAGGGIGSDDAGDNEDSIEIDAARLAAEAGTGDVNVVDQDLVADHGLVINEQVTRKDGDTITGVSAGDDVCIDVVNGALDVNEDVTAGDNVALRTQDADADNDADITIGNDDAATGTEADVVSSTGAGTVSLESGNGVVENNGTDNAMVVTGGTLVINAESLTATTGNNQIEAAALAASVTAGDIMVDDLSGDLEIVEADTLKGGDPIEGVSAPGVVCVEVLDGSLTISAAVQAGTVAAVKAAGDINSNATMTGGDKVSVESGGAVIDGNGDDNNFVGSQVVISAEDGVGTMDDAIEIDSDQAAVLSNTADVNLSETSGDLTLASIELEKNGGQVNGVEAATTACIDVLNGALVFSDASNVVAPDSIAIRTSDTLVLGGSLSSETVSLESTGGDILDDGDDDVDVTATNLVMRANGDIGSENDALDTSVDMLAAEATNGSVNIVEQDEVKLTNLDLIKGGDEVGGIIAGTDVNVRNLEGDMLVNYVEAGRDVTLQADRGNIVDCNENELNVKAGRDVNLLAPQGCVGINGDNLEIMAGRNIVIVGCDMGQIGDVPLPPGVFAQDNVNLGEHSFYLDYLYGYIPADELELIIDELSQYQYGEDADFLLEKHPDNSTDDDDDNEENK